MDRTIHSSYELLLERDQKSRQRMAHSTVAPGLDSNVMVMKVPRSSGQQMIGELGFEVVVAMQDWVTGVRSGGCSKQRGPRGERA